MADEQGPQNQPDADQEQRGVLNLSFQGATTNYANLAVLGSTPEEVVMNFGINVMPPNAQRQVNVQVSNRIIMTYPSAKRLAIALSNVIQRYESRHGVIDVTPQPPVQQPAEAPRPGPEG